MCTDSVGQEFGQSPEGRLVYVPQCVLSAGKTIRRCIYSQVWFILVVGWDTSWLSARAPIDSLPSLVWASLQHGGLRVVTLFTVTLGYRLKCSGKQDRKCIMLYVLALVVTKHDVCS